MKILFFAFTFNLLFCISVFSQEAVKVDEITDFCCERTRTILDNFLAEIQKDSKSKGFVIFYGGKNHSICETNRLPKRAEINLIEDLVKNHILFRKQDPKRFTLINGGYREIWTAELWIVPNGAENPKPTPTLKEREIKFKKGTAKNVDLQCEP